MSQSRSLHKRCICRAYVHLYTFSSWELAENWFLYGASPAGLDILMVRGYPPEAYVTHRTWERGFNTHLHARHKRITPHNMTYKCTAVPCKGEKQSLLTLQLGRYCLLPLQSRCCSASELICESSRLRNPVINFLSELNFLTWQIEVLYNSRYKYVRTKMLTY